MIYRLPGRGGVLLLLHFRGRGVSSGFRAFKGGALLYHVYLDEFGHIGPYIAHDHPTHNTSPVFGLGGIALPYPHVRYFATWFYKLKCNLLAYEIEKDGRHPAKWEKKGSALYTAINVDRYRELRTATFRIITQIEKLDGFPFYYGIEKNVPPKKTDTSDKLFLHVLRQSIIRLNKHFGRKNLYFNLYLDQNSDGLRKHVVEKSCIAMFGNDNCKRLLEPPFQVESHLYQTLQCADWMCGIIGKIFAYDADPASFQKYFSLKKYFWDRINNAKRTSTIRTNAPDNGVMAVALATAARKRK